MVTRIRTGALAGLEGLAVSAEVDISRGLPGFHLVGLPGAEVRESRDRVLSALRNSDVKLPAGKITVNLAPAGVRKTGASFDLAIALGILEASGQLPVAHEAVIRGRALFLGELSLFGDLRPVRGLLSMVLDAAARGVEVVVVPAEQMAEARVVAAVDVVGASHLSQVVAWWRTGRRPEPGAQASSADPGVGADSAEHRRRACRRLAGLDGQPQARKAACVAVAGRHNLLLVGPPGTGKTRLARLMGRLQTPLDPGEGLVVTRIQSAAGTLKEPGLATRRPFRAPHHTITRAGLIGGGAAMRPGEATLAHGGMLFLDELTEFAPAVLDVLREPLQEGRIAVARGGGSCTYPARFQLVAAMNPCRCGFLGSATRTCRCRPGDTARYLGRLSGPLLDRFDMCVEMGEWNGAFLEVDPSPPAEAVERRPADWRRVPDTSCLEAGASRLESWSRGDGAPFADVAIRYLERVRRPLGLSLRGVGRCSRVAATLAALDGAPAVAVVHVQEALEFRREILGWGEGPP